MTAVPISQTIVMNRNRKTLNKLPEPCRKYDYRKVGLDNSVDDWDFVLNSRIHNIAEDRTRIRRHRTSISSLTPFVKALDGCLSPQRPCYTMASARFLGEVCWRITGEMLRICDQVGPENVRHLTLIGAWLTKPEDLTPSLLSRIHDQLKTQFKRYGVTAAKGGLILAFDGSFDGTYIRIHVHGLIWGDKIAAIRRLRKLRSYNPELTNTSRPIKLAKIKNPRRQIGYPFKSFWNAHRDAEERHPSLAYNKWFRMIEPAEAACLQMLHETPVTDWLILNGVRLGANAFVET